MKCLKCGSFNSEAAVYCQSCATYLAEKPGIEYFEIFKALVLALLSSAVFYLIFPMPVTRSEYLIQLFSGRISELIFTLTLWSLFLIFFKFIRHRQQQRAYTTFRDHELHESLSEGIYVRDVEKRIIEISQFLEAKKVKKFQNSVIFRRIRRILFYLRAVPKKEEINTILNYQAEIDHNRMQTGYTLINVFIWAIPILGFIGTVFGIGQSIGEFSQFIRGVETSELSTQMRSALSGVTQGLSVAFNTTFLALVGVIPVMLLSSTLRKGEEDLLLSVEEYCLEDLLPNLHVRPGEETMDEAVHEHLGKLVEFSENWRKQVAPVMSELEKQSESLKHQVGGLQPLLRHYSDHVFQVKDRVEEQRNTAEGKEDVGVEEDASDIASVKFESTEEKPEDAESGEETSLKEETPSTTLEENNRNPDPVSEKTESREQEKLKAFGD